MCSFESVSQQTTFSCPGYRPEEYSSQFSVPELHHAAVVVRRLMRSNSVPSSRLRERLERAAMVLDAATPAAERAAESHRSEVTTRIASRILMKLGIRR
ncbi:MAG: hypothetical protein R3C19_22765 [Planctomycetaceae bacterium]